MAFPRPAIGQWPLQSQWGHPPYSREVRQCLSNRLKVKQAKGGLLRFAELKQDLLGVVIQALHPAAGHKASLIEEEEEEDNPRANLLDSEISREAVGRACRQ